jgi:hypothetical protein
MPKTISDDVYERLATLERDVGLAAGFCRRLLEEDDWSFVVKLYALLEAATTQLLVARFRDERLEDLLAELDLGSRASGKVAFAAALGLLSTQERRFIAMLIQLHRHILHSVNLTHFTFESYLAGLDGDGKRKFIDAFAHGLEPRVALATTPVGRRAVVMQHPKLAIWSTAIACLGDINLGIQAGGRRHPHDDPVHQALERHLAEFQQSLAATVSVNQRTSLGEALPARGPEV